MWKGVDDGDDPRRQLTHDAGVGDFGDLVILVLVPPVHVRADRVHLDVAELGRNMGKTLDRRGKAAGGGDRVDR